MCRRAWGRVWGSLETSEGDHQGGAKGVPKAGYRGARWGGGSKGACGSGDARGREVLGTRHAKG